MWLFEFCVDSVISSGLHLFTSVTFSFLLEKRGDESVSETVVYDLPKGVWFVKRSPVVDLQDVGVDVWEVDLKVVEGYPVPGQGV